MSQGKQFVMYFFQTSFVVVQLLSRVWLFVTGWTAAQQASRSFTTSWSLLKLMSIESVMASNRHILCHPLPLLPSVFPSIRVFPVSQLSPTGGQSIGALASASVLPMNIQGWFPLGSTGLSSLQSKGLSRVFCNTTFESVSSSELRLLYDPVLTSIHDCWKAIALTIQIFVGRVTSLLFNMQSRFS